MTPKFKGVMLIWLWIINSWCSYVLYIYILIFFTWNQKRTKITRFSAISPHFIWIYFIVSVYTQVILKHL